MVTETRRNRKDGLAFTLLEMLLTVALLVALLGAVVYNFESARRGSDLEEGGRQIEALIRFAAAEAANSGKAVQLRFGEDVDSGASSTSETSEPTVNDFEPIEDLEDWGAKLRVVYESDPVLQPGIYLDLPAAKPFLEAIYERVRIEKVRMPERPLNQRTNDLTFVQQTPAATMVTFYPDGSSESADIVLVSKDRTDFREIVVRLDGVTGSVRTELKAQDELIPIEWMEDESSPNQTPATVESSTASTTTTPAVESSGQPTPMPEDPAFSQEAATTEAATTNFFDDNFQE